MAVKHSMISAVAPTSSAFYGRDRWRRSATRNRVSRRDREGIRGNGNGSVGGEDGAHGRDSELDAGPGRRRMSADWSARRRQESGCEGDGQHGGNSNHRLRSGRHAECVRGFVWRAPAVDPEGGGCSHKRAQPLDCNLQFYWRAPDGIAAALYAGKLFL